MQNVCEEGKHVNHTKSVMYVTDDIFAYWKERSVTSGGWEELFYVAVNFLNNEAHLERFSKSN